MSRAPGRRRVPLPVLLERLVGIRRLDDAPGPPAASSPAPRTAPLVEPVTVPGGATPPPGPSDPRRRVAGEVAGRPRDGAFASPEDLGVPGGRPDGEPRPRDPATRAVDEHGGERLVVVVGEDERGARGR